MTVSNARSPAAPAGPPQRDSRVVSSHTVSETVQRYLLMLQSIPRQPRATHTGALVDKLAEHGIKITQRSVQRDLEKLEAVLPLRCDASSKPYRWFWEVVNPLGLAFRESVIYLVCSFWDYDDVNHLVLHRMTSAKLLEDKRRLPPGFNLDDHIQSGGLGFPLGEGTLRLVAVFDEGPAVTLRETPLSKDQKLTDLDGGAVQVEATVPDTMELRAWLRSYGELVTISADLNAELQDETVHADERSGVPARAE